MLWRCWLGGRKGIRPVKTEWWVAGVVICLEQGADLHMAQLMPLPLTVSCFSKIQIGFTFLVPAHLGSPGKRAVKRVCACCYIFKFQIQFRGYFAWNMHKCVKGKHNHYTCITVSLHCHENGKIQLKLCSRIGGGVTNCNSSVSTVDFIYVEVLWCI